MKRIYLLVTLLIGMAGSVSAQTDMKLLSNVKAGDTIKWNKAGGLGRILVWGFANMGPNALVAATDTIVLKRAFSDGGGQSIRLSLPAAGVKVNDTVYYSDTVFFAFTASAPQPNNPYNWCDSIWVKRGSAVYPDPTMGLGSNQLCANVIFKEIVTSSVANVTANANGLSIYPNPASGVVNVTYTFNANTQASITVRDMTGKAVYNQDLGKNTGERNIPINISSLSSGLYFVELNADNNKVVSKFTVQ